MPPPPPPPPPPAPTFPSCARRSHDECAPFGRVGSRLIPSHLIPPSSRAGTHRHCGCCSTPLGSTECCHRARRPIPWTSAQYSAARCIRTAVITIVFRPTLPARWVSCGPQVVDKWGVWLDLIFGPSQATERPHPSTPVPRQKTCAASATTHTHLVGVHNAEYGGSFMCPGVLPEWLEPPSGLTGATTGIVWDR